MSLTEIQQEAVDATYDPDDLERALVGPFESRKRALMRVAAGSYKRGWDEAIALATLGQSGREGRA